MSELVRSLAPAASIFYNSGHIGTNHRDWKRAYSHFELETLPSGEWGYLHFPVTARYARTLGLEILGQTGKFHGSWGDFHSYKNEAALEYECFRMLSLGAACLIGDQLRPRGELEPEVYRRIGKVYAEVERVEPWCVGASPLTEIGVLTPEETEGATVGILPRAIKGATRMLEELACQFDILDSRSDFSRYRLLVLPDRIRVDERLETRLEGFLDAGGAILASFGSGLNDEMTRPVADFLGIEAVDLSRSRDLDGQDARGVYFERNDYAEYLRPGVGFRRGLGDYDLAMYLKGVDISAQPGAKTLAEKRLSYFDRDWRHFCSHRQTPCSGEPGGPAIIKNGRSIYFAHPVFEQYQLNAPLWCKALVSNAIEELLPGPLLRHDGPSGLRATICEQRSPRRLVVHLLYYVPERRGELMDIVEEGIALRGLGLEIRAGSKVTSVRAVPDGGPIPFRELAPGFLFFEAPEFTGRLMLEVNLE